MTGLPRGSGAGTIRALFLADTHLGFDLPFKPRVKRRRRGHDFFANFERAIKPALAGEVDFLIHGGDLLYRSKVPAALLDMAISPLIRVAESGVPVFIVPGNHERSKIPLHLWGMHPNLHIFDQPKTYTLALDGGRVAVSGFPFHREIRDQFRALIGRTEYEQVEADVRLLCIHAAVEGAQVGPANYTFRHGPDVIPGSLIPKDFAAVLSGHIHRSQVITHNLRGKQLLAPVIYPGSIERTSFAERKEKKHYVSLEFCSDGSNKGKLSKLDFIELPARPMVSIDVEPRRHLPGEFERYLKQELSSIDPDSVVRLRVLGEVPAETSPVLRAAFLREIAPGTMNISLSFVP